MCVDATALHLLRNSLISRPDKRDRVRVTGEEISAPFFSTKHVQRKKEWTLIGLSRKEVSTYFVLAQERHRDKTDSYFPSTNDLKKKESKRWMRTNG